VAEGKRLPAMQELRAAEMSYEEAKAIIERT